MLTHTRLIVVTACSMLFLAATTATAQEKDGPRTISPKVPADQLLQPPDRALDDRIDPEKVGKMDPPTLPETITLPLPPTFRIADSPDHLPISEAHWAKAIGAIDRGLAYLREQQDQSGGLLTEVRIGPTDQPDRPSPVAAAVTAMAIKAMVQRDGDAVNSPHCRRALDFVLSARNPDGSFEGGALSNYVTSVVVSALASLDDPSFGAEIIGGTDWLMKSQWHQAQGLAIEDDWFGGAGYGNRGRPDMSNTQMMLDALYDAGISPDEPAFQRAVAFLSRAQNLSETNPAEWAGDDGGFIYTPAGGGESMASEAAGEGRYGELIPEGQPKSFRSYGSMTYAGFKSLLYAGLSPDDIRVRAAFDWIRRHFTFDENPGLGQQGLYYYYHAMARALVVSQQNMIEDGEGETHSWREELIDAIVDRQREDGSWVNEADRWLEGQPVMATVYSVLALEEALKDATYQGAEQGSE